MSKTIPSALLTHYEGSGLTLALLWKVTRQDGGVYAFTSHNEALTFDGVTYSPSSAFSPSAAMTRSETNVDDMEVLGLLDTSGIIADDIERGLWDKASVEVRRVNWASLSDGAEIIRVGEIGTIKRQGNGGFVAELRGLAQALQNNIGYIVSPLCNANLGDARCGKNLASFTHTATVTAVDGTSPRRIFTASALSQAAGYFASGQVTFTSGDNSGVVMDVKTNASGVITLQLPVPYDIDVGDTLSAVAGCDKRHTVADDGTVTGDCKNKFDNVVNFRGFWAVPGRDQTFKVGGQ